MIYVIDLTIERRLDGRHNNCVIDDIDIVLTYDEIVASGLIIIRNKLLQTMYILIR